MNFFCNIASKSADFEKLLSATKKGNLPIMTVGLPQVAKALAIVNEVENHKKALVITADESAANALADDIKAMGKNAVVLPLRDLSLADVKTVSHEYEQIRTNTLFKLLKGDFDVCLASVQSALSYTVPPEILEENTLTVRTGATLTPEALSEKLIAAGYVRCDAVDGAGQFAIRGGIADVFGAGCDNPVRFDFFGDTVDALFTYDILSNRRCDKISEIALPPAREIVCSTDTVINKLENLVASNRKLSDKSLMQLTSDIEMLKGGISFPLDRYYNLIFEKPASVFDYLSDCTLFVTDTNDIVQRIKSYEQLFEEEYITLFEQGVLFERNPRYFMDESEFKEICAKKAIFVQTFTKSSFSIPLKELITFNIRQIPSFSGNTETLIEDINSATDCKHSVIVMAGVERACTGLCDELVRNQIPAVFIKEPHELPKGISVVPGGISQGFELTDAKVSVFTHTVSRTVSKKRRSISKHAAPIGSLEELKVGELVVHDTHGIGIFQGVHRMENHGVVKDYIKISYAKNSTLYIPVISLDSVSRYIGAKDASEVKLSRLGGQDWQKTRARVKAAVKDIADKLIKLYAVRMSKQGYAFSPDSEMQRDFECRFEFEETEDQLRCAREIKDDMERPVPMDRLLCGDVGFGKTEVALRAAFKCVLDGKQVAILVPTTILAWQHYQTAIRRFGEMPVEIGMLSRFVSPAKQREIISNLKTGKIDILIGTHRTISNDVNFRDLGLLIIDEEQRFGVAQKEKLKEKYPSVDILTLSATPIPRTLNMAVSGLRDMSSLDEAPQDRYPVQTYVVEQNDGMLCDAIKRELRRNGQIYYLHNHVESIYSVAAKLKGMLPDCNIEVAHGKMSEDELSGVWERLINHEVDLLVCTTIIETGVDVPNVNTLIIEDADRMGLSQLHQLRGRVGRSPRRAYAYFCFKRGKALTEIANKRLLAIREYTEFGAGYKIAMRDLEIRGAGDILGASQHGHMTSVGYDTYIKLLEESICEQKGEKPKTKPPCNLDLDMSANIPEKYIPALSHRLQMYRRIADISNEEEYNDVMDELCDRFGKPPQAVISLMDIAILRRRASSAGIYEIKQIDNEIRFYVYEITPERTLAIVKKFGKRVTLSNGEKPFYRVAVTQKYPPRVILDETVNEFLSI